MRATVALSALLLSGCAVVFVHTDGKPVQVSFGLGSPEVSRGQNDAVAIRRLSLGIYQGCMGGGGVGVEVCIEYRIDPQGCGLAIVSQHERPSAEARTILAKIADSVRAECPQTQGSPP